MFDVTLSPTELTIIGMNDPLHEQWEITYDSIKGPDGNPHGIAAQLKQTYCFLISGFVDTRRLAAGRSYEIEFKIWSAKRRNSSADHVLSILVEPNKGDELMEKQVELQDGYGIIKSDKFKVTPSNSARTRFHLVNTNNTAKKELWIYSVNIKIAESA